MTSAEFSNDVGILLVAHGTPTTLDDLPAFLQNIRRGRPTPPALIQAVRKRYEAIGGSSPLLCTTRKQAALLTQKTGLPCLVATRMWHPMLDEVLGFMAEAGTPKQLIIVSAAPHSAHVYALAVREVAEQLLAQNVDVPALHFGGCWGANPHFINAWAKCTACLLDELGPHKTAQAVLVPTAHSLPLRTIQSGDPYTALIAETANAVVEALGPSCPPSLLAFQSQGMSNEPWLGPDLATVFRRAKDSGAEGVIVVPIGFPSEHVETLYDLDIEARALAQDVGVFFERVPCLDLDDGLISAMACVVNDVRRSLG